jgi:hypothetical protein
MSRLFKIVKEREIPIIVGNGLHPLAFLAEKILGFDLHDTSILQHLHNAFPMYVIQ